MFLTFLASLPGILSGLFGTLNGITAAISNEKINAQNAATEQERIHAQERVNTLQARRDLMIAESAHSNLNIIVRSFIGGAVAIVLVKLLVWDKVVGSLVGCAGKAGAALRCATFNTDPLDDNQWKVISVVVGFYFLYEASTAVSRIFASKRG
jgi:cadmium resistance protein CadD (predicted permease)